MGRGNRNKSDKARKAAAKKRQQKRAEKRKVT